MVGTKEGNPMTVTNRSSSPSDHAPRRRAPARQRLPHPILAAGVLALLGTPACAPSGLADPATAAAPAPEVPRPIVDRNHNGRDDAEEIRTGFTPDTNGNGVPDDLEPAAALAYGYRRVVVFGDSLSDTGNMWKLHGLPPAPPNWEGRYSNGPVWVEYLTSWLGLEPSDVKNYAYGGATTGHDNASVAGAPGLLDEVRLYADDVAANGPPGADTLFVLWIGPNDFAAASDLADTVNQAMINVEQAVTDLAQLGARKILVLNAPDLGKTPRVHDVGDPAYIERARLATLAFNSNLAWTLGRLEPQLGIDVIACDFFSQFERIAADPLRFGLQDAQRRCLASDRDPPCPDADQRVFWDGLHPTTAAHRVIAKIADVALLTGGDPLPEPGVTPPAGMVVLDGPANGTFVDQTSVTVTGVVLAPVATATALVVNDVPVVPDANGRFSVQLPLAGGLPRQPIVATLSDPSGKTVIDRDRVVVFQGPSVGTGETVTDAILAELTRGGLDDVEDLVLHQLVTGGALNIRQHLLAANPIASNFLGTFQYVVSADDAGYAWSTLELDARGDRIGVRVTLHDVFVNWNVHAWLQGLPDPGFDCWGRLSAGMFSIFTELSVAPTGTPGEVRVQQLAPLRYEMTGFAEWHACDFIVDTVAFFANLQFNVQQRIESGIDQALNGINGTQVLPDMLQQAIARVSASRALGGALGIPVSGNITRIAMGSPFSVGGDLALGRPGAGPRTIAVPHTLPTHTGLDPVAGQPYDFAVTLRLALLNQLLAAQSGTLLRPFEVAELDLGSGPVPLTAGRLAALIPALRALDPAYGLRLRIRPTLPPMLLGHGGNQPGTIADLAIAQLIAEVLPAASSTNQSPFLSLSLDIEGGLALSYDTSDRSLVAQVTPGTAHAVLLDNPLGIDEATLTQLIETLAPRLVASMGHARFALPELAGIDMVPTQIVPEGGCASLFFRTATPHGAPDLVLTGINAPAVVDRHFGFSIQFGVRNDGTGPTIANGFVVSAFLSLDANLGPEDPLVGSSFYSLSSMGVGDVMQSTLAINPVPGILDAHQHLFVVVDCPLVPGGAGNVWERRERNNVGSVSIQTTDPDAYVAFVQAPTDVVGGIGPRDYRVRVGRNPLGIDTLSVPVTVTIGDPPVFWNTKFVDVPRGQEIDVDIPVFTPAAFGSPGQVIPFQVLACANLQVDANRGNDCASTMVGIAVPHDDLGIQVQAPGSAQRCGSTGWRVNVTNHGNRPSVNGACGFTHICPSSQPGFNDPSLGFNYFWVPSLAPGQSWAYDVGGYQVWCNTPVGPQYFVKAEFNTACGGFLDGNDSAAQPISIY